MPRKTKDPFARQYHPEPNFSLHPDVRFQQRRIVGEYLVHIGADGTENCFLHPPRSVAAIPVTVFTQEDRQFDCARTWLHGDAHAAMLRLPASSGWQIVRTEKHHAHWERPAPVTRTFVG